MPLFQRKLFHFMRKPAFVKYWLIPTWIMLGLSKLAIQLITFSRISRFLGSQSEVHDRSDPLLDADQERYASYVREVTCLAARYTPWHSNCFCQALTSRVLLGLYKIPYAIFFGVRYGPLNAEMKAHAWVVSGNIPITIGNANSVFTVVACFSSK